MLAVPQGPFLPAVGTQVKTVSHRSCSPGLPFSLKIDLSCSSGNSHQRAPYCRPARTLGERELPKVFEVLLTWCCALAPLTLDRQLSFSSSIRHPLPSRCRLLSVNLCCRTRKLLLPILMEVTGAGTLRDDAHRGQSAGRLIGSTYSLDSSLRLSTRLGVSLLHLVPCSAFAF